MYKSLFTYKKPIIIGLLSAVFAVLLLFSIATWHQYERAEFLTLFRLIVDILVLPVTMIGFLFAVYEIRKAEAKPEVELSFEKSIREVSVTAIRENEIPENSSPPSTLFRLQLLNTGESLARWYSVEMETPYILNANRTRAIFSARPGNRKGRWSPEDQLDRKVQVWNFWSDGTWALYLNHPLTIADIEVVALSDPKLEDTYEIPYKISSEWGKPTIGKLVVRVT